MLERRIRDRIGVPKQADSEVETNLSWLRDPQKRSRVPARGSRSYIVMGKMLGNAGSKGLAQGIAPTKSRLLCRAAWQNVLCRIHLSRE